MKQSQLYQFHLKKGIFITCLGSNSAGFLIYEQDFNPVKLKNAIKESASAISIDPSRLFLKVIGSDLYILKWKPFFSEWNTQFINKEGELEFMFYPHENRTRVAQASARPAQVHSVSSSHSPMQSAPTISAHTATYHSPYNPSYTPTPTPSHSHTNPQHHSNTQEIANQGPPNPIKLLIVDDSKTIRTLLRGVFSKSPNIEIVADTGNPLEVISLIDRYQPHVVTLDIHMPEKDGITLLKEYIHTYPIPTVMISSISMEEGPAVLTALESGAVDYIQKPEMNELAEVSDLMIEKIKTASTARVHVVAQTKKTKAKRYTNISTDSLIAIGSSTGGTEALKKVFSALPDQIPPIVVVQHIPPLFSKAYADRLNSLYPFEVKEAETGDLVLPNRVLIAPGGRQMKVIRVGGQLHIIIDDSTPVNRHKPSVDVLFDSLVECRVKKGIAAILTGMGSDGAKGMLRLKEKGWTTIAQDKDSCVVFGMPAVAIQIGAAEYICSLDEIPSKLQDFFSNNIFAA
jgi:two-component system chemotaxis response regulator CheB